MSSPRAPLLKFDNFEIDLESGELRKSGVRLKLPHQPFRVLEILASRPGTVRTRREIERALWGDNTHVDFENGLNYCIKLIRAVLDDDANAPRYIETLPRRGYRFLAPIEEQDRSPVAFRSRPMLAVLPFGNLTDDDGQDYFTDGLTEELIGQLGRLNPAQLGVIAFTTARQYRNTGKGIDQIGKELGVDFIVEGSVRRAGDRVRITTQLIQVSDQSHLWAEAHNRTLDDIISIQIDVAERVAQALAVELLASNKAVMKRTATHNSAAYEAYLRGRYYFNRRTEEDFRRAFRYFEEAIERDPGYVPAYTHLADVYALIGLYSGLPPTTAHEGAMRSLRKALELNGAFAEAHSSLAYVKLLFDWDFSGAEKEFRHALAVNPNHPTGHYWYALFLAAMGRTGDALEHIADALHLDPLSLVVYCNRGWILYLARRYDEAASQLRNTIEMDQSFALAHYFLGLVYLQQTRHADATAEFQKARDSSDNHPASISGLAVAAASGGDKTLARRLLKSLEELARRRYVTPYYSALIHAALENKTQALDCLERAFEDRSPFLTNIRTDPALDSLRRERRFGKLLQRMRLPSSSETRGTGPGIF